MPIFLAFIPLLLKKPKKSKYWQRVKKKGGEIEQLFFSLLKVSDHHPNPLQVLFIDCCNKVIRRILRDHSSFLSSLAPTTSNRLDQKGVDRLQSTHSGKGLKQAQQWYEISILYCSWRRFSHSVLALKLFSPHSLST